MSDPKKYSLKPIETQLLNVLQQQHSALLSNVISFIVIERLAIQVDKNTQFSFNEDMTEITIGQNQPEEDAGVIESVPPKKDK